MIKSYLQVLGVPGNSTDPAHHGWSELVKLVVEPGSARRRVPSTDASLLHPILVHGWSIHGPHSFALSLAWISGKDFPWVVLEVFKPVNKKPVLKHRLRMRAVRVESYHLNSDPGLIKPIADFVLVPATYTYEVGSALQLMLEHERPHAGSGASTAAGGPPRRPVLNDRTPPGGHV